jgi:hypothetical protein
MRTQNQSIPKNESKRFLRTSSRRGRSRSGAAVIEFSIILPVLVLLLLGTLETCSMIFLQQSLKIAAYEGARVAIIPKTDAADVNDKSNALLNLRKVKDATITITPSNFDAAPYGTFIRIEVSAPCDSNSMFPLSFYGGRSFTGTVEMMKEFD